jgi:uracil-DNA glycosylase family 4
MATEWTVFCGQWIGGCGNTICAEAQHVCLARGTVPCDILFVGEAPSIAADTIGEPFIGEMRAIMDPVIKDAGAERFRHAFTNLVCCVPRDPEDRSKVRVPADAEILACRPRLRGFIELCEPKLIMAVGTPARLALEQMALNEPFAAPVARMLHPAKVLYARPYGGYERGRMVDALAQAISEHLGEVK